MSEIEPEFNKAASETQNDCDCANGPDRGQGLIRSQHSPRLTPTGSGIKHIQHQRPSGASMPCTFPDAA
jgi:hypothetical protein